ncbi:MAG TPA: hypothetical protein VGK64_00780 [Bryobacteraceae bacterium]
MASPTQLAANRANSQLSTGPTSSQGKAKVSSAGRFAARCARFKIGRPENRSHRPHRPPAIGRAVGRRGLAAEFADEEDEVVRKAMIEAQVFLTYRRDLNNLSIQEARLRRQYEKDEAELKRRIADREQVAKTRDAGEHRRWQNAIQNYRSARLLGVPFDPAEIGFEFSVDEIAAREQQQLLKGAIDQGRYYEFKNKGWLKLPGKAA